MILRGLSGPLKIFSEKQIKITQPFGKQAAYRNVILDADKMNFDLQKFRVLCTLHSKMPFNILLQAQSNRPVPPVTI